MYLFLLYVDRSSQIQRRLRILPMILVAPGGSLLKMYGYYVRPESRNHDPLPCHFMLKNDPFYRIFFENYMPFYRFTFLWAFRFLIKKSSVYIFYDHNIRSLDPFL